MDIGEFINIVSNTCFPVAVSAYLLIKLEKQLKSLTLSINTLNVLISTKLNTTTSTIDNTDDAA